MLVVISPAKSLDFKFDANAYAHTQPMFLDNAEKLVGKMKKLKPSKLSDLMKISDNLAELNYQRYQDWSTPFDTDNSRQALFAFTGDVYRGLDAKTLDEKAISYGQDHLRILSGLYGLLRPLDLIQEYRLEMGTRLQMTSNVSNLYKFWGDQITDQLNEQLDRTSNTLINLASNEYFKSVNSKKVNGEIITPVFKDYKNGTYKTIMTFAKIARGMMTRYIVNNQIGKVEDLKSFDINGYKFSSDESSDTELVFLRKA